MRFYKNTHTFYAGIDLHARTLYLCITDADGNKRLQRELKCRVDELELALAPFREGLVDHSDEQIRKLERYLERSAKIDDPQSLFLLKTIPDIGKILALTILYEFHSVDRFPTVRQFISYCVLVKCAHTSAGKTYGTGGAKIGNAHDTTNPKRIGLAGRRTEPLRLSTTEEPLLTAGGS